MDVLANWTWQGAIVAIAATIILKASRRMSATTRYSLWWVTLAVVLALPGLAWLSKEAATSGGQSVPTLVSAASNDDFTILADRVSGLVLPAAPTWAAPVLFSVWLAWLALSVTRIVFACIGLRRVRRATREFPDERQQRLPVWLSVRGQGRPVTLTLSDDVRAAAVIGLVSPTIAVAPRALDALTDAELDQIVVHEWAHVQRGDDIARLVQRLVTAVAGLHPAVWWIDRQLNLERETACDDWAIRAAGSPKHLAVCLTKLAALPGRDADVVLTPAALIRSELTTRVTRLLDGQRNTSTTATIGVPMIVTTAVAALAVVVASVELVVTAPQSSAMVESAAVPESKVEELPVQASVIPAGWGKADQGSTAARPSRASLDQLAGTNGPIPPKASLPKLGELLAPESHPSEIPRRPAPPLPAHPIAEVPFESTALPGTTADIVSPAVDVPESNPSTAAGESKPATPWGAAASAGVNVGRGSQKAAVATAGFFTKLGKSISGAF